MRIRPFTALYIVRDGFFQFRYILYRSIRLSQNNALVNWVKQTEKRRSLLSSVNAIKQCSVILLVLLCLLLSGCQKSIVSIFTASEHTELVVDGEYKPFNVPRKTMEKLIELVEAGDADYIYAVFSPAVREKCCGT